jgi:ribonuclease HII
VDESGRGPLAGPVVAAAVVLRPDFRHPDLNDSKLLTPRTREKLAAILEEESLDYATAVVSERIIERVNIRQASLSAMRRAVIGLSSPPQHLLVDAFSIPGVAFPQWPIVKGDRLSASIAAASIMAKITRDRLMEDYHQRYTKYNFRKNKGYGTEEHRRAIRLHGPCAIHRRTFRGVKEYL